MRLRLALLALLLATAACENPVSVAFNTGGGGFEPDSTTADSTAVH